MRKIVKAIYNPFIKFYFSSKLKTFSKQIDSNQVLVLDIDNTISDTWKYLHEIKNNRKVFLNLPLLEGTCNYVKENYSHLPIIFLSNRNILDFNITKKWLDKHGFNAQKNLLILTNNPSDKLRYLKFLSNKFSVVYFDDLSYNHENGKVLFYEKIIDKVKKMNLKYYDSHIIANLNSNSVQ